MLLTQALLLSFVSLRSSAAIFTFDSEADNFCYDDCFVESGNNPYATIPCNGSVAGRKTRRVCNTKHDPKEFRINANDATRWDVLSVANAATVKLEPTRLAHGIHLDGVPNVILDSSVTGVAGFRYLKLDNCHVGEEYTLSFVSLKEISIVSSVVGVIMQTSLNEIDILNGSLIKKLTARIQNSTSTFNNSTIDKIEMLNIAGNAMIVMTNMTIKDVQNLEYASSKSSSVTSSYIEKITSLTIQPSSGKLKFYEVEIGEIISNGVTIMGKIEITNSVIHKSPIKGITISGSGEIAFSNVTINGVQLSYTLKADPSSNSTVSALYLSVMAYPSHIVYYVIIAVLAVLIVVLLPFFIKQAIAKRNSNAAGGPDGKNLKSNDPSKESTNIYAKSIESQDIPIAICNKQSSIEKAAMPRSGVPPSQKSLTPPHLSASQDSFDVSTLPPPPPQMLLDHANTLQPIYNDIEGGESDTQNSFMDSPVKASVGQKSNYPPSPNPKTNSQASHALHPKVPSHAARSMIPDRSPNPAALFTAVPISSHYATRGDVKPPPPSRNPPPHRKVPQPTGGLGQAFVQFHPAPDANMPDYQEPVQEVPLYASEDELRNY